MASLPVERVVEAPPFTHVGMDMFGHFIIKQGRKEFKRYGCIFTCLASRAVHLEVTATMDTDSLINALRRFISRRGRVSSIRTDNGSNFIGASNDFRKAANEIDVKKVGQCLREEGTELKWNWNPPLC